MCTRTAKEHTGCCLHLLSGIPCLDHMSTSAAAVLAFFTHPLLPPCPAPLQGAWLLGQFHKAGAAEAAGQQWGGAAGAAPYSVLP